MDGEWCEWLCTGYKALIFQRAMEHGTPMRTVKSTPMHPPEQLQPAPWTCPAPLPPPPRFPIPRPPAFPPPNYEEGKVGDKNIEDGAEKNVCEGVLEKVDEMLESMSEVLEKASEVSEKVSEVSQPSTIEKVKDEIMEADDTKDTDKARQEAKKKRKRTSEDKKKKILRYRTIILYLEGQLNSYKQKMEKMREDSDSESE